MSAHNPDVIERVAEAMWSLYFARSHPEGFAHRPEEYRRQWLRKAKAALDAINALYEDEGGEVPTT